MSITHASGRTEQLQQLEPAEVMRRVDEFLKEDVAAAQDPVVGLTIWREGPIGGDGGTGAAFALERTTDAKKASQGP